MSAHAEAHTAPLSWGRLIRDLIALSKPRITTTVLITMIGGLAMAPERLELPMALMAVFGVGLIVAGANTLNMWIERDIDRHMTRTKDRPLPSGRMTPGTALAFGLFTTALAIPILLVSTNPAATALAAFGNASYVLAYTPLKQRTWFAVVVGAVPGAVPPLIGYAAARGGIDMPGLSLFVFLFLWQIPHFHAIALFRAEEYGRAGLQVLPNARGIAVTKLHIAVVTAALVLVSLAPWAMGMVSSLYLPVALVLGAAFLTFALGGLREAAGRTWARRYFFASMPYLVLVFGALIATKIRLY